MDQFRAPIRWANEVEWTNYRESNERHRLDATGIGDIEDRQTSSLLLLDRKVGPSSIVRMQKEAVATELRSFGKTVGFHHHQFTRIGMAPNSAHQRSGERGKSKQCGSEASGHWCISVSQSSLRRTMGQQSKQKSSVCIRAGITQAQVSV